LIEVVMGIDLGTTRAKVGLFTRAGEPVALGRQGYPVEQPRPGWAEQDPNAWWEAIVHATRQALAIAEGSGVHPGVTAISVAGQGPTTVAVDEVGRSVRPAITWLDTRASAEQSELQARLGIQGWRLTTLPRERWLMEHEPAALAASRWLLSPWEWLTLRLAGVAATAAPPGPVELTNDVIVAAGCDPRLHPPTVRWGARIGDLQTGPAAELGLPVGVPVVAGGNDAFVSFVGAGLDGPGDAIDTGGTSGGFGVYWDRLLPVPGAYVAAAPLPDRWLYGGAMSATGKALDWLSGIFGREGPRANELLVEASATSPGADGLLFLPYLAGERSPIFDDDARGVFAGLTLRHGRGHLVRAVMEGAAFAIRHVAEPILAAGIGVTEMRVSGATAASPMWNQIKADVTGFRVAVPRVHETATLGAAVLAALGIDAFGDTRQAMTAMCQVIARLSPRPELRARYDELYAVYRELYPATATLVHRLGRLPAAKPTAPGPDAVSSAGQHA
jgi:xylulokinase